MKRLTLLAFAFLPFIAFSQTKETALPVIDVYPKSPEVTALEKFGDVPVGLYTGIPDISVPIWNVKVKGLSIPVSLNYHSSGNKVNDIATAAGLGWAITAGGVVSSTVHGIPDLTSDPIYNRPVFSQFGWPNAAIKLPQSGEIKKEWTLGEMFTYASEPAYLFIKDATTGRNDTEPDLFNVSYGGNSIKFYFDQDKNIHLMPYKRVKITMTTLGFTLIDEFDNTFEFNTPEVSTTTSNSYTPEYVSKTSIDKNVSYLLSSITTAAGETITFGYSSSGTSYSIANQKGEERYAANGMFECGNVLPNPRVTYSSTNTNSMLISSITSSAGDNVVFTYASDRQDFSGAARLTGITVSANNQLVKSFELTQDYYDTPNPNNPSVPFEKRLRLLRVTEAGKGPYIFEYNTTSLPKRLSFAQDHWGYFNGSQNDGLASPTLLPLDPAHGFTTGANREVDLAASQAGILTAVTYPLGGKSVFEYELNDTYITEQIETPVAPRLTESANISSVRNVSFSVPAGAYEMQLFWTTPSEPMETIESNFGTPTVIKILQGSTLVRQLSGSNNMGAAIALAPGNYTAKICSDPNNIGVYFQLNYRLPNESNSTTISENRFVGGLRVKKISDYAEIGGTPIVTTYEYKQFAHPEMSSGIHSAQAEYIFPHYVHTYDPNGDVVSTCKFDAQNSGSLIPLSSISGGNVFYEQVRVYKKDKQSYGYVDTRYFPGGISDGSFRYPYTPVLSADWLNGLVLESTEYAYRPSSNDFTPVHRTQNSYKTTYGPAFSGVHESSVRGAKIALVHPLVLSIYGANAPVQMPVYAVEYYALNTSWSYPVSTTETSYDTADPTKNVVTVKDFHFDNSAHLEMTSQLITRSSGDQYKIQMRYPLDVNPAYTFNSSPVVENRTSIIANSTERLISADLTLYRNTKGSFPVSYYRLNLPSPVLSSSVPLYYEGSIPSGFEKRLDYTYDNYSNIANMLKDGQTYTGYHWVNNLSYPVAACVNASADEFYYEGFEDTGVAGNAHAGLKYYNGTYTANWTKPNLREYKISYFYFSANKWIYKEEAYPGSSLILTGGTAYDDVKIYPVDSQLTSFTYDNLVGMTSQTDAKGMTTYYVYDEYKRLKYIKDQDGNIIKSNTYHYKP